jgi:hypothetical protein
MSGLSGPDTFMLAMRLLEISAIVTQAVALICIAVCLKKRSDK